MNCIVRFDGEYRFLSNFYSSEITLTHLPFDKVETEPITYVTLEHAYQAAKTAKRNERKLIVTSATPGAAKRFGKNVTLRPDWEDVKEKIMLGLLIEKFTKHEDLKSKLMATKGTHLVEGNLWHDNTWGVCFCICCSGLGKNLLGTTLMKIRDENLAKD